MEPKLTPGGFCNLFTQKGLIRCPVGALAHGVFDFGGDGSTGRLGLNPWLAAGFDRESWLAEIWD